MNDMDYDDPAVEEQWCNERRAEIAEYLQHSNIPHGEIGEWPAWHIAPYVSIWAIESKAKPGWLGWWVICGDLPTDYISADNVKDPRSATRAFGRRWLELSEYMARGESHPEVSIGEPEEWPELAPLLATRAKILLEWAADDQLWEECLREE